MLTPLLLVSDVLGEDESQFNGHRGDVSARKVRFDGGCQQDGVRGGRDQEEQDALDE